MDTPEHVVTKMMEEWDDQFCPRCEWNLKGVKPNRFCSHCDYVEEQNRKGEAK